MSVTYKWRGEFDNAEINALHAEGFEHRYFADDRQAQLSRHSLGWVCAREDERLVGFVNVAWDGALHAFLLDTLVARSHRGRGIGTRLVALARQGAQEANCEWLHVDFEDHLKHFYLHACGFTPTKAGLIKLA